MPDPEMNHVQEKPGIKDSATLSQTDSPEIPGQSDHSEQTEQTVSSRRWWRYGKHVVYAVIWMFFTG